jgi:hypothetical protein
VVVKNVRINCWCGTTKNGVDRIHKAADLLPLSNSLGTVLRTRVKREVVVLRAEVRGNGVVRRRIEGARKLE